MLKTKLKIDLSKQKRNPVFLTPMSEDDFRTYQTYSIQHYAMAKVKAGTWTIAEAMEKSEEQLKTLLPDGTATINHYLWSIVNENKDVIGWLWLYADPYHPQKEAFIYDFGLYEAYRGQGNGQQALKALEEEAKQLGIKKLSLHVFAHNKTAKRLYEKMNFETTDLHMSKRL
ncbi:MULTISPECIES: GNAT family N-acetyltransferase [Bacillus]|uniref:GNAT family N-acetyltransferase n=1 Tax=Bacillus TaxID=1386 RepID=UPI0003F96610|nr:MULTISPECIES: GNAT family N-acetyltransferase [Bacillus]QHZ44939.1 GNAT family N-acetyltransferase [Bacillus sp. NSP9.1]WFA05281.1 GNAT family N-acetyltransferase [Bacillus sp. HSf4]